MPAMIAKKLPAAALGLLACVLLFSALLGLTGVANKSVQRQQAQQQQTRAEEATAVQGLRGGLEGQEERSPIQAVPLGRDEGAMRMEADGVVKPQASPAKSEDATSLRAIPFSGAAGQVEDEEGSDASLTFPEQKPESFGLWGPDEEERAQLEAQLGEKHVVTPKKLPTDIPAAEMVWPSQKATTNGLWGPDTIEREQLAKLVVDGDWDRLMEEMDGDFSFSFEF